MQLPLRCECGLTKGLLEHEAGRPELHLICYCKDCQAMAAFLRRRETLNAGGGTDVFQVPAGRVKILAGADNLHCLRLTPRGVLRWFTACCNTSVANVASAGVPLIGLVHTFIEQEGLDRPLDAVLGAPVCCLFAESATGDLPAGVPRQPTAGLMFRRIATLLYWIATSQGRPHPFFDARTALPISSPRVLKSGERAALENFPA